MGKINRQWLIADRPNGRPLKDSDFAWVEKPAREPGVGEVKLRTLYLGFDPALKGWMENIGGYQAPTELGETMRGSGIGEVIASNDPSFQIGDLALGQIGWQEFPTVSAKDMLKIDDRDMASAHLGVLGTTGLTAFFGLQKIGRPFPGDTVVVTGAAGATGSVVGQIAKICGCKVIGVAGGAEKCGWLVSELGYDAAVDYKSDNVRAQLKKHAPGGIDVLWDNVGGKILNSLLGEIALHARVVICGGISRHETGAMPVGPENYFNLVFKRATMSGFILTDWASEFPWARARLSQWLREGRLKYKEDVQHGLENAPRTLMRLFSGANFGKQLLKVS